MKINKLSWEPESSIPPQEVARLVFELTDGRGNFSVLKNGTVLFVNNSEDDEKFAKELIEEASSIRNFSVIPVDVGGYLVEFHKAIAVFVGADEFSGRREEILERLDDLIFPGEKISMSPDAPQDHALIGIYARGKLQRDANNFSFHARIP